MKSLQIEQCDPEQKDEYSELQVLVSAAGYYVGTIYNSTLEGGIPCAEPGSRDSIEYFATKEEAGKLLAKFEAGDLTGYRHYP